MMSVIDYIRTYTVDNFIESFLETFQKFCSASIVEANKYDPTKEYGTNECCYKIVSNPIYSKNYYTLPSINSIG